MHSARVITSLRMHPFRALVFFAIVFTAIPAHAQQDAATFAGKLEPRLWVDSVHMYQRVWSAAGDTSNLKFSPAPEKGAVISTGELIDQRVASGKSQILLVEPPGAAAPYLWFDANENGIYEAAEKVVMDAPADRPAAVTITLRLPVKQAYFKTLPIFIHYIRGLKHPRLKATDRLIAQSVYALAMGRADIRGRKVLFQYPFQPEQAAISTTEGLFGVDGDGDGRIRDQQFSSETSYAANDELVFPLRDIFVSTKSIDTVTGQIVIRQRNKSEYKRVDLEVGMEMPDFAFVDLDGKQRRMSEFRGKYLLVDFWGVWCHDCIVETPFHLEAYERFKARGFEILGLDTDEKVETVLSYVKKNNMTWPQATNDSIKQLKEVTYRIQEYPSTLLLGPDGKVLVLDQDQLRGDELLKTLERVLAKPSQK